MSRAPPSPGISPGGSGASTADLPRAGAGIFAPDARLRARQRVQARWQRVLQGAALLSVIILAVLLTRMLLDGLPGMGWDFWTNRHTPSGLDDGTSGIRDAMLASVVILAFTMVLAVPVGTAAGIYLHEYATKNRLTDWIRATVSNLAGVPSVVYGLLGLAVFVRLWADFGGPRNATNLGAAATLAVLILPILIVATEEALKTVPESVRHASLGLGATRWQTIRSHVIPYALPGILTGQILALSRAAGETAPVLILGLPVYSTVVGYGPLQAATPLQVRAYFLAEEARATAIQTAAGTIVVLLLATLVLNLAAIVLRDRLRRKIRW